MWEFVMRNVRWVGSWGKLYQIPHSSKRHHILLSILAFPEMSLSFFTTIYYPLSLKHQLRVQHPLVRWVGPSVPIWAPFPVTFSMMALIHHTALFVHFVHSFLWNVYWEPAIFSPELWVLFILWLLLLFSHLVMSSLWTLWIIAWQAPLSMDFPDKNTGVGCHFLLQRTFPTQGLNPHLLHWQAEFLLLSHQPSPDTMIPWWVKKKKKSLYSKKCLLSWTVHSTYWSLFDIRLLDLWGQ